MGLPLVKKILFLSLFFQFSLFSQSLEANRVLYLMRSGKLQQSLNLYQEYYEKCGQHDLEVIQQLALLIMDQGANSGDAEMELMALFGAGVSMNEKAIYILEYGLRSIQPQLQLIALNLLAQFHSEEADAALNKAMTSNYLLIRVEALYHLAEMKFPSAFSQAQGLMSKIDDEVLIIFPEIFGMIGSADAVKALRKLLAHKMESVRIAAILAAAKHGRDDLLPCLRTLASQHSSAQQEAVAFALGILKDSSSVEKLKLIAASGALSTRLAALYSLFSLGQDAARQGIEAAAREGDLFAITLLGKIVGSEELLFQLAKNDNVQIKTNAMLALLELKDARAVDGLKEILIKDARDLAYTQVYSPGQALAAYRVVPSAKQNLQNEESFAELSLKIRESILTAALNLPEATFIDLAKTLFRARQNDLIPILVTCLETLNSPKAIELLKSEQQKAGSPLIRNYCNLALFRLQEEGPYAQLLYNWVAEQQREELIRFRPLFSWGSKKESNSSFQLNPEETSKLLIEAFEALTATRNDDGITMLLHAIQYGNVKNRYALAGMLMRAAQ